MTARSPIPNRSPALYSAGGTIAANACRLFDDAKLLVEHGRYPAAQAVAILAIEEVGKYHVYGWKFDDPAWLPVRKLPPRHTDKQAVIGAVFGAIVQMRAMCEICSQLGASEWSKVPGANDWEKTKDFLLKGFLVSQHGKNPEIRERAVAILNAVAEYVEARVDHHPLACLVRLADSGEIDKAKQAALYVDVAENGAATSDPTMIGEDAARFWFEIAEVAIASLVSLEAAVAAGEGFTRRFAILPPSREPRSKASAEDRHRLFHGLEKQRESERRR